MPERCIAKLPQRRCQTRVRQPKVSVECNWLFRPHPALQENSDMESFETGLRNRKLSTEVVVVVGPRGSPSTVIGGRNWRLSLIEILQGWNRRAGVLRQ